MPARYAPVTLDFRLIRAGLPETDVCREWYGDLEVDEDCFSAMLAELEPPGRHR